MPGDPVATVAEQDFVLRLLVPERHARFLKAGDPVRVDGADVGLGNGPRFGTIKLVYPKIEQWPRAGRCHAQGPDGLFRRRARAGVGVGRRARRPS